MDEKDFKKHLKDLAEGRHHPEEHDWDASPAPTKTPAKTKPVAKRSAKSAKPRKRSGK